MQQREKILAGGLGAVVAMYLATQVLAPVIRAPIVDRENALKRAENARDAAEEEELETLAAIRTLSGWTEDEALAGQPLSVLRLYREWLYDLAIASDWQDVAMTPNNNLRAINAEATPIEVRGTATATAAQLARFLQTYEATPILQGLTRLKVTSESSEPDSPLQIELDSVAIVMDQAKPRDWGAREGFEASPAWVRLAQSNPFTRPSPAASNQPPRMRPLRPRTVGLGEVAIARFGARDPDGDSEEIRFELPDPPAGATIDADAQEIRFEPAADADGQTVTITLKATDEAGVSATMPWTVSVEANAAATTELVGSLMLDDDPVAWLLDRSADRRIEVRPGDSLNVGRVEGTIESIGPKSLEFVSGERRFRLRLGQKLTDAVPVG